MAKYYSISKFYNIQDKLNILSILGSIILFLSIISSILFIPAEIFNQRSDEEEWAYWIPFFCMFILGAIMCGVADLTTFIMNRLVSKGKIILG